MRLEELIWVARTRLNGNQRSISRLIIRLATIAVALGVAAMEIAHSVVSGYDLEIRQKLTGFTSHIQIGNYMADLESKQDPLPLHPDWLEDIRSMPEVRSISPYILKAALAKSKTGLEGILLKGIDASYDTSFIRHSILFGQFPGFGDTASANAVVISSRLAARLQVTQGEKIRLYFLQDPPRIRNVRISGIYNTGYAEFDEQVVFCDMRLVRKILGWDSLGTGGFEIRLHHFQDLESATNQVNQKLDYTLEGVPVTQLYPEVFAWLRMQYTNVGYLIILLGIISGINLLTVILILSIEQTRSTALLSALGMRNRQVYGVQVWQTFLVTLRGLVIGNGIALLLIGAQHLWGWATLPEDTYYISRVAVAWPWHLFLFDNVLLMVLAFLLPVRLLFRTQVSRSLRFE